MKCPKCGMEVKEDAIFCKYCGASLVSKKPICPKCGKENDEDAKFCENCGTPLVTSITPETKAEDKPSVKKDSKETKAKLSHIFSMILSISMIVYFALSMVLLATGYLSIANSDSATSFGFKEMIDLFKNISNPYPTGSVGFQIMDMANGGLIVVLIVSTLLFFAAIITFGIIGIVKEAKSLKAKKESSSDKYLIAVILSTVTFYALIYSTYSISTGAVVSMGSGIASIVGLGIALLVLKLVYRFVFTFQTGKGFCFASYICIAVLIFQTIGLLTGLAGSYVVVFDSSSSMQVLGQVGFVSFFSQGMALVARYAAQGSISVADANAIIALLAIPMVLTILVIIGICVLSYFTVRNLFKEKNSLTLIVFPAVMLCLSIILTILFPIESACLSAVVPSVSQITSQLSLGSMGAASIVSSCFILAGGIVSFILKGKAKENTYLL